VDSEETYEWMHGGGSLLAILRLPFCCLDCFSINVPWDGSLWNWNIFSSELRDALSNTIHSSTLKTLILSGIVNVPITLFLHTVHFTTLELHSITPNDFGDENSSSLTQAASEGVAPMASHTAIDRCVWHLSGADEVPGTRFSSFAYFLLIQDREDPAQSIFLPFMCSLRFFKIYVGICYTSDLDILSSLMGSLCVSLTSPATLEHLEFKISFYDFGYDFDRFHEDLRDADVWRHLDSFTIHPTGSRLQRVDIFIDHTFRFDDLQPDDEIVEAVLDSLPSLRTKGILFVEATVID
jgi:hypothetical protein